MEQVIGKSRRLLAVGFITLLMALGFSVLPASQAHATNSTWSTAAVSSFAGGSGISSDPYQIATAAQLAYLSNLVASNYQSAYNTSSVYYELTADIYLNDAAVSNTQVDISNPGTDGVSNYTGTNLREWCPIGGATANYSFKGHFNGNGYKVYYIFYNHSDGSYVTGNSPKNNSGLFGKVEVGAEVKNVTVSGGYFGGQRSIGAVVGKSWGSITNCHNNGVYVFANQSKGVGGIVGANWVDTTIAPVVDGCSNSGTVESAYATGSAGGIAGENEGVVRNCWNNGTVKSPYNAGGIVGSNKNVRNKQTPDHTGEIGGYVNSSIMNCYSCNDSSVIGGYAGGIAGYQACQAENCYNKGAISAYTSPATDKLGQLFGQINSTATNSSLYYLNGTTAIGLETTTGHTVTSVNSAAVLLYYLNNWVTTNGASVYRSWQINSGVNGDYPIIV